MSDIYDMHCHLDWFSHSSQTACEAADLKLSILAVTVTPAGYERARATFSDVGSVAVAVGAHPWWVGDARLGDADILTAATLAFDAPFVGEIGLDHSYAHVPVGSEATQAEALKTILEACDAGARAHGSKVLSIHAVRCATTVLDLLEKGGCAHSCSCIFHWFSGSGDELHRAVRLGCFFSVNEMMLRTRRGRDYARQIPLERLLTETDLPPHEDSLLSARDIAASIERTLEALRSIRSKEVRDIVADNAATLLSH